MRDAVVLEIAIREIAVFCAYGEIAHHSIDRSGAQPVERTFFHIHSLLSNYATVARLLRSEELAGHAGGKMIAELLGIGETLFPPEDAVAQIVPWYDLFLSRGLAARGSVDKVLDSNIGDRDAFEEEGSFFLRHYDPTVDVLTLVEEEIDLSRVTARLADVRTRTRDWMRTNTALPERPATISVPPSP